MCKGSRLSESSFWTIRYNYQPDIFNGFKHYTFGWVFFLTNRLCSDQVRLWWPKSDNCMSVCVCGGRQGGDLVGWSFISLQHTRSYLDGYRHVTVHSCDFILLPHRKTRLPAPWPDNPSQTDYPDSETTSPCSILIILTPGWEETRINFISYWFDLTVGSNPRPPTRESTALPIRPPCPVRLSVSGMGPAGRKMTASCPHTVRHFLQQLPSSNRQQVLPDA